LPLHKENAAKMLSEKVQFYENLVLSLAQNEIVIAFTFCCRPASYDAGYFILQHNAVH
jgi:hypothetical protein